jgi:glycosyltransferase involved in cell wall biosynthesis
MISIAMATYNGERHLVEQINSILNQSLHDIELVVCDDCSTDRTYELLCNFAKKDARVRIFRNEHNLGFKKNFEKAIELCSGEYIALSDQDDIWLPNHLEVLLDALGDKMLACGNAILATEDGGGTGVLLSHQESLDWVPDDDLKKAMSIMLFRNPYQGAAMLFRRELVSIACPIPDATGYHDKWLAMVACMKGGMNYTFTPVLQYRRSQTSITDSRQKRKSKIQSFRFRFIHDDRLAMAQALLERVPGLGTSQRLFLKEMVNICNRNNDTIGRLKNSVYFLFHYKTIYSCDSLHWV